MKCVICGRYKSEYQVCDKCIRSIKHKEKIRMKCKSCGRKISVEEYDAFNECCFECDEINKEMLIEINK